MKRLTAFASLLLLSGCAHPVAVHSPAPSPAAVADSLDAAADLVDAGATFYGLIRDQRAQDRREDFERELMRLQSRDPYPTVDQAVIDAEFEREFDAIAARDATW